MEEKREDELEEWEDEGEEARARWKEEVGI